MITASVILVVLALIGAGVWFWLHRNPRPAVNVRPEMVDEALREMVMERVLVLRSVPKMKKAELDAIMYKPCACGSGKKYKFCCKGKPVSSAQT